MKKEKKSLLLFGASLFLVGCSNNGSSQTTADPSRPASSAEPSETHVHQYGDWIVAGNEHYHVCTICGEEGDRENHHGGTSTCTSRAVCEVCSTEYGELDDHSYSKWTPVEGTDTHTHTCSVCGETKTESHTWNEGKVIVPETHTTDGVKEYTCTKCDGTKTEAIPKRTEHIYDQMVESDDYLLFEGSCTEGATYFLSCTCGKSSDDMELTFVSTNFGHNFVSEVAEELDEKGNPINLLSKADCEHAATYYQICSVCDTLSSETFTQGEALGHSMVHVDAAEPSFASGGIEHEECSRCGKCYDEHGEEIDPSTVYTSQKDDPTFVNSEENPYTIRNERDLVALHDITARGNADNPVKWEGVYFKMIADVTLTNEWKSPIGLNASTSIFKGNFDGDGHSITGLKITREAGCTALFGNAIDATIKNLDVADFDIASTSEVASTAQRSAIIVGRAERVTLENVNVLSGTVNGSQENGGLIGVAVNGATITNCSNAASVNAAGGSVGGLIGNNYSGNTVITNCTNTGTIKGVSSIGGLVGRLTGGKVTITGGNNAGVVNGTVEGIGGIVGWQAVATTQLYISNTVNQGAISRIGAKAGVNGCGGFLGLNLDGAYFEITDCVNRGDVYSLGNYVGGFVGLIRISTAPGASSKTACSKVTNCTQYGNVTYGGSGGSIAGINRGIISGCKVLGTATVNDVAVSDLPTGSTSGSKTYVYDSNTGGVVTDCSIISE
ncbi:MAG: hypothetical protein MJ239_07525 [Bacilli bacterium]|nr:hypothetical protein [Bacilli bacterium]